MNIFIDNEKIDITLEKEDTLKSVLSHLENFVFEKGRVISEWIIDGKSFYTIDINLEKAENIEIITKTPRIVFLESLQEMNTYIEKFQIGIEHIVDYLSQDNEREAMKLIVDGISGLEWIYNVFFSLKSVSEINFEEIGFDSVFEKFQQLVEELVESLEMKDNIMLSDLLEYEVSEILNEIKDYLPDIYDYVMEEERKNTFNS